MAGALFHKAIKRETGRTWEQWAALLDNEHEPDCSYDELIGRLEEHDGLQGHGLWIPIIAGTYEQRLGRKPVGLTADAGFQIGVRRTVKAAKEEVWRFLLSPDGLKLWIGKIDGFPLQKGSRFESEEGVSGELRAVNPGGKLRMAWKRPEWDRPSTLQIYLLTASGGGTTVSFHQEKLDDLYMREIMKLHWEHAIRGIIDGVESAAKR